MEKEDINHLVLEELWNYDTYFFIKIVNIPFIFCSWFAVPHKKNPLMKTKFRLFV